MLRLSLHQDHLPGPKDEISMVDAKLLDLLEAVACNIRGNRQAAFGGLQVGTRPRW